MAIRIGLPPSFAPRVRVRWSVTRAHVSTHLHALQASTTRIFQSPYAWGKSQISLYRHRWSLQARLHRRQVELLNAFEAQYEDLVDLLCWAAQDGVHSKRDATYSAIRTWMCSHYSQIRSKLRPHWLEPEGLTAYDPFEALFMPEQIDAVLNACTSIEDMMLCRQALDAYRVALQTRQRHS
jgi:hypothetical protein